MLNTKFDIIATSQSKFRALLHPSDNGAALEEIFMAHFYFHLSAPDEYFLDNIGYDVSGPGAAYSAAVRLADRVTRFVPFFLNRKVDFRRWTVKVTDEEHQSVIIVMFPRLKARGEEGLRTTSPLGASHHHGRLKNSTTPVSS
jgi:hypothetical protein